MLLVVPDRKPKLMPWDIAPAWESLVSDMERNIEEDAETWASYQEDPRPFYADLLADFGEFDGFSINPAQAIEMALSNYFGDPAPETEEESGDAHDYFAYLDALRESGATNMFGATPYLMDMFPELSLSKARGILSLWMKTFQDRHAEK